MPDEPAFPTGEYRRRLGAVQAEVRERGVEALILFGPNNLFYLSGYETIGYSNFQFLVVPAAGEPRLLVRELEAAPARSLSWMTQEPASYADDEDPLSASVRLIRDLGLDRTRVAVDQRSFFLPVQTFGRLRDALPQVRWSDGSGVVERVRAIKSAAELACFRSASRYTSQGMRAALDAVRAGTTDNHVGAAASAAMYESGSEYVASGPTVTTGRRSGIAHTTFARHEIATGDAILIELGGVHRRYTTALMRSAVVGRPTPLMARMYDACDQALDAAIRAIRPGVTAGSVHDVCQAVIDEAGFEANFRKRLGYSIGIGFAPGWGEGAFLELSKGDPTPLEAGMVFHLPPALRVYEEFGVGCSETLAVTESGAEILTDFPRDLAIR